MDNRVKTAIIALGLIFLVFYWTHGAFVSLQKKTDASIASVQEKTQKALELYVRSMRPDGISVPTESGLLTYIEDTAQKTELSERLSDVKPKKTGAAEAAVMRLDSLTGDEAVEFIRLMETPSNIRLTSVSIKKRFDNEKRLNLVIEAEKQ
ncbi:MAG: hypothetical protein AB7E96_07120 [Deferribacterales bacterium]